MNNELLPNEQYKNQDEHSFTPNDRPQVESTVINCSSNTIEPPSTRRNRHEQELEKQNKNRKIMEDVTKVMNDILISIEIEEQSRKIKENHPKPIGLNEPQIYLPTKIITSPLTDPAKKRRKRPNQIDLPKYDPEDPTIKKQPNYDCTDCEKSFRTRGSLNRHRLSNHSEKTFSCDECNKTMLRKDSVKKHYQRQHPEVELPTYITMNTGDSLSPYKSVKFNLKSKTTEERPKSQFSGNMQANNIFDELLKSITALKNANQ
jgi:hypothetical protein